MTTPIRCSCGQRLHRHCVCVVNDYFSMHAYMQCHACIHAMSCMHTCNVMHAYMYPHSQRLRRHGVSVVNVYVARNFRKWNQIKFFVTLSLVFYFSKVLKSTVCQSSQQLRGHTFFREYLRKNEIFLRNRCCLFICSKGGVKSVKDFIWIISLLATFTH